MSFPPFLSTLATTLFNEYQRDILDICIVFPNQRAGLFFRKYLSEVSGIPLLGPSIYTINELMTEISGFQVSDPVDLVFEIYEVYSALTDHPEKFDDFYHWGETMIRDFDDLDKSLVNAESLFGNILDLKKIDTVFDFLTPEQKATIRKFWGSFNDQNLSGHQQRFLESWNILFPLYSGLTGKLRTKKMAYEGLIYREVAEKILNKNYPEVHWNKIILAGFNALTEAEKILFRHFRDSGLGRFYWDYDIHYTDNLHREAGRFLRVNVREFPQAENFEIHSQLGSQEICIYELPSDVTQAKFIHKLLEKRSPAELAHFHDTAVILGNENLLIPVLYSIPSEINDINVTMGYPLNYTPVYGFLDQILKMQGKVSRYTGKRKNKFYYKHVLAIIDHQYTRSITGKDMDSLKEQIRSENMIYLEGSFFQGNTVLQKIFQRQESLPQLLDYLISLLCDLGMIFSAEGEGQKQNLEKEYVYNLLLRVRKLRELIRNHQADMSIETFSGLFRKVVRSTRIPFKGEPLGGIQIMGLLETRLLDFRNLILMSMNEGIVPRSHNPFSFIPNNLRYAFNMPTREYHDAIYAYYFYRMLQRSEKVNLLFNSQSNGLYTGEMSRYLHQLRYDRKFKVQFKSVGFNIQERPPVAISIPKSPEILNVLGKYITGGTSMLSPSALNSYLDCHLKFYFSRIAGLSEPDDVVEEIEAREAGTLLHEAMRFIYSPFIGKNMTTQDFHALLSQVSLNSALEHAFRKVFYKTTDPAVEVRPEGKNIIVYEVIKKYIEKILESDRDLPPFTVLSLEEEVKTQIQVKTITGDTMISVGGTIDRIDKMDEGIRIIDYKTGQAKTVVQSIDDLFNPEITKRNRAVFQILMYVWIYENIQKSQPAIMPFLYITRDLFDSDFNPLVSIKDSDPDLFKQKNHFTAKLKELIAEIYDQNIPFNQTTIIEYCRYCNYAGICHRNNLKEI